MSFMADIPHFFCKLRAEYVHDLKSHAGEFYDAQVFAVDSVAGHAIGFDCLTSFGAQFARLPISAFCWKEDAPPMALEMLELWDNFSYDVEAHEYASLRRLRCACLLKDRQWYYGRYLFTLSWLRSQYADHPGDGGFKRAHIVQLDNGNYAAQPNNRMRWFEPSFITKPFPEQPSFITNTHVWNSEDGVKWSADDNDRFFYDGHTAQ